MTDKLFSLTGEFANGYSMKYNKYYIGLTLDGIAKNFVSFKPQKTTVLLHIKHKQDDAIDELINNSDLEKLAYDRQWSQYRLRLYKKDLTNNKDLIKNLMKIAYDSYTGNNMSE